MIFHFRISVDDYVSREKALEWKRMFVGREAALEFADRMFKLHRMNKIR